MLMLVTVDSPGRIGMFPELIRRQRDTYRHPLDDVNEVSRWNYPAGSKANALPLPGTKPSTVP